MNTGCPWWADSSTVLVMAENLEKLLGEKLKKKKVENRNE